MGSHRKERLEELIKRIIGDALLSEIKDPRIGFASVVRVDLSKDYTNADVWVSVLGGDSDRKRSLEGLESACAYIQHLLGWELKLRVTHRIRFHMDDSIEKGVHLVGVIDGLVSKEEQGKGTNGAKESDDE
jgi:ribosome-binding factor A